MRRPLPHSLHTNALKQDLIPEGPLDREALTLHLESGAGEEIRTLDVFLGKEVLYH